MEAIKVALAARDIKVRERTRDESAQQRIVRRVDHLGQVTTPVMTSTTLRKRTTNSSPEITVTNEGRETDKLLDSHTT